MDFRTGYIRTRLSLMFFLQFFVWATWWAPVFTYAVRGRPFLDPVSAGMLLGTTAIGAMISPLIVGPIADRLFATERVLCVLHVAGGLCLFIAAQQEHFWGLYACLLVNAICFMPTLALGNSLTFRNIKSADLFPRIALFGSIAWIISGWLVSFWLKETSPRIFYAAGAVELLLAAYCLTLPHTPPQGKGSSLADVFGLKAVKLLRDPAFLVFVVCAFLIVIVIPFYFAGGNLMLKELGLPATALMTIGQVVEICVMFSMPWLIGAIGLRAIFGIGMAVWAIRYVLFATMSLPFVLLGLLLHGFAYCFIFVGSYIYVDKKAPPDLRASAQSFIAFLMLGVGMFLGSNLVGLVPDQYPAFVDSMRATQSNVIQRPEQPQDVKITKLDRAPLPDWKEISERLDRNQDGQIWINELQAVPNDGFKITEETRSGETVKQRITSYDRKDLENVFTKIDDRKPIRTRGDFKSAKIGEISVDRADWMAAQVHRWPPMWLWFAAGAAVICGIFTIGSLLTHDESATEPASPKTPPKMPSEPSVPSTPAPSEPSLRTQPSLEPPTAAEVPPATQPQPAPAALPPEPPPAAEKPPE